ncbi:hypothetical protein OSC27_06170 [Microbacterium sp. STN6]|uniref:hypothetical protein n=1 Tax=Microbacterium sp. STN6 TaxID=2995588 RepID=UPI00226097B2|nr:hypothetical protein [Microbacterium sp. STN6]MCX7521863.1 hypothetical protein [Microbacterium sp. STN6]
MIAALATAVLPRIATEPPKYDPDAVTPGVWGFVAIFVIAVVVVLLVFDMVRRIRRVRYRDEIRQKLDAEQTGDEPGSQGPGR